MEINYKFDDSKDEIQKGVKKNKFTHDRIHTPDTPEFDPSSGLPDEGYGKDHERIESDNPSFEGNYWFVSKNFNDHETNKRPLHPQKDYLNPQDAHTGDDHLETIGVTHPEDKVPHHLNPNTDHENYDIDGKMDIDDKGGHHLMGGEVVKEEIKHIYKEKTNTMKSTMQEQIDRIKQMILFEEGMSYKDVKHLTEQEEEIAVVAKAAPAATADMVTTLSKGDAKAVADKGAGEVFVSDKVSAEVPVEKGTEKVTAIKQPAPGESEYESPIQSADIDAQIKAVNNKITDVKAEIEKTSGDDEVADLKSKLEQLENDLDKLKSQKDAQEKEEEKPVEEKPKEEPKDPVKGNPLQTLNINEATKVTGMEMQQNGFFETVRFVIGENNYILSTVDSPMGNTLGNADYNLNVNYYSVNSESVKGTTTFISTKAGKDSEIFTNAMGKIGVKFNTMLVPAGFKAGDSAYASPHASSAALKSLSSDSMLAQPAQGFSKNVDVTQNFAQNVEFVFDSPIQAISENGIVVYSFFDQASIDNAQEAGPAGQNAAIAAEVELAQGPGKPGGPGEPGASEFITATGGGNTYELELPANNVFGSNFIKDLGPGEVTKGEKPGHLDITFGKTTHAKYGKGELKGYKPAGVEGIFILDFYTPDGDNMTGGDEIKFKVSKTKAPVKPFKSAKFTKGRLENPYSAYQTSVSRAGQFTAPVSRVAPAQNPFAQSDKYDVFGGGGKGVTGMNNDELKTLIQQLQSQLDGQEEDKEELNESRRRNSRRRPTYRTRLTEGTIMKKVEEYSKDLTQYAKKKGVPVDDLMNTLKSIGTGSMETLEKVAEPVLKAAGEFLGVLKANKEISDNDMKTAEKNLNEAIRRSKNVIKLTEGDLYKIVDRVLKEKK